MSASPQIHRWTVFPSSLSSRGAKGILHRFLVAYRIETFVVIYISCWHLRPLRAVNLRLSIKLILDINKLRHAGTKLDITRPGSSALNSASLLVFLYMLL